MDLTLVTAAYSSIKHIKEISKLVLDTKIDIETSKQISESIDKLGDVQDTLFELREELIKQQEEKEKLKAELLEAKAELKKIESVEYRAPSYWAISNGQDEGPYCQRCFDDEHKLIRLQQKKKTDFWICKKCDNNFEGPNYVRAPMKWV